MNKLITKVVGVSLGLTMALGVGLVAAKNSQDFEQVWASGGDESVTFSEQGYSNQQAIDSYSGTDFTITFDKGSNSNPPKYYTSGSAIRAYGGNTFTVSSATKTFVKISLTFGNSDGTNTITTNKNTYTEPNWTGTATNSVTFTIGGSSGNRRLAGIDIYYSGTKTLSTITATTPTKTTYVEGEIFDPTGSVITGTYSDSSTTTISASDVTWANSGILFDGQTSIQGSYNNVSFSVSGLTVNKKSVSSVTEVLAASDSQAVLYRLEGIVEEVVNSTYGNIYVGLTATSDTKIYCYGLSADTTRLAQSSGTYTMTTSGGGWGNNALTKDVAVGTRISILGYKNTYNSSPQFLGVVRQVVVEELQSITATPSKTTYAVGQSVQSSDVSVSATFAVAGSVAVDFADCTITPSVFSSAGTIEVTVSYTSNNVTKTSSYNVTVANRTVTGIVVKTNPTKTSYAAGETFNSSGLVITASYDDALGDSDLNSGFTTNYDSHTFLANEAGTVVVTVTYSGKTATFSITVTAPTGPLSGTRYYIMNSSKTIGLNAEEYSTGQPSKTDLTVDNNGLLAFDFTIVATNTYQITTTIDDTVYYLVFNTTATSKVDAKSVRVTSEPNANVSKNWVLDTTGVTAPGAYHLSIEYVSGYTRYLANYNSNDWRGYQSTSQADTDPEIYLVEEGSLANSIAQQINNLSCNNGATAPSVSGWSTIASTTKIAYEKNILKNTTATPRALDGSASSENPLADAMAKYDYIVGKYNKTLGLSSDYPDFLNRNPDPVSGSQMMVSFNGTNESNKTAIIAIEVALIVSFTLAGGYFFLKKKHQ